MPCVLKQISNKQMTKITAHNDNTIKALTLLPYASLHIHMLDEVFTSVSLTEWQQTWMKLWEHREEVFAVNMPLKIDTHLITSWDKWHNLQVILCTARYPSVRKDYSASLDQEMGTMFWPHNPCDAYIWANVIKNSDHKMNALSQFMTYTEKMLTRQGVGNCSCLPTIRHGWHNLWQVFSSIKGYYYSVKPEH